jgi:REP element-mobilizing transposase RayT
MARPLRIEYPDAWYHVMNRGRGRRNIFLSDADRQTFLGLLEDASKTFHIQIHAYCLLDNHYHLLIHTPDMGLARAMRHINGVYTQKFNKSHRTDGSLFKGRYKAPVVDSDEYLLELIRYIHLNPVDAGMTRQPHSYPWSSHKSYLSAKQAPGWLVTDEILGHFGRTERAASQKFDEFVRAGIPDEMKKMFDRGGLAIGDDSFCEWIRLNFIHTDKDSKEFLLKDRKPALKVSSKRILSDVAFVYNTSSEKLRRSEPGKCNDGRNAAIYLLRHYSGKTYKEIAKWMNVSNEYAVAKAYQRFKENLESDKELGEMIDSIIGNLSLVKT